MTVGGFDAHTSFRCAALYAAQMCGTVQRRLTSLVRDQLAKWRNVSLQENKNSDQAS